MPASVSAGAASPRKRIVAQNSDSGTMKRARGGDAVVATAGQESATPGAPSAARGPRAERHRRRTPATAVTGASQAQGSASRQPITGS